MTDQLMLWQDILTCLQDPRYAQHSFGLSTLEVTLNQRRASYGPDEVKPRRICHPKLWT